MEITPTQLEIVRWLHKEESFEGNNFTIYNYGISLTPPDPTNIEFSYFTVQPEFIIKNENKGMVFNAVIKGFFTLKNKGIPPLPEQLFECVKVTYYNATKIFKEKTINTNLGTREYFYLPEFKGELKDIINSEIKKCYEPGFGYL